MVELALNGVDFVTNDDIVFTFIGPNAGKMLWVYVLITIFTALLIIVVAAFLSSYWNNISMHLQETKARGVYSGDIPHVVDKRPRYQIPELRNDLGANFIGPDGGNERNLRDVSDNEMGRRNLDRMV